VSAHELRLRESQEMPEGDKPPTTHAEPALELQGEQAVAPETLEYEPLGHTDPLGPVAPRPQYCPGKARQGLLQLLAAVLATAAEYVPMGQGWHSVAPSRSEKVPDGHGLQP
jgi:hypothetical protein